MKLIIFLLLIFTILFPLKAEAKENSSQYFSVHTEIGTHKCIAPNDCFSDTFTLENLSEYPLKIRVSDVSNINNSALFSVLKAKWTHNSETNDYLPFHKLTTDWYTLEPGKTLSMNLNIYFPYHLGNEYQASSLQAKFTFECNIPKNKELHINMQNPTSHHVTFHVPETGDASRKQLLDVLTNCMTAFLVVTALYVFCGMFYQKQTGNLFFPFGYRPVVILSGSMENELMTGSTVIVKKTKDVKENDIIFFIAKDGTPVIHRYISTDEAGKLITKGDANPKEDLEKVELDQVQGKVLFH